MLFSFSWLERSSWVLFFTNLVLLVEEEKEVVTNESRTFTNSIKFIFEAGRSVIVLEFII